MAALQAEMGYLSAPVNHVQTAEMGNQSLNSLALISTRYTHVSNDVFTQMIAIHIIALCQALDLRVLKVQFFKNFAVDFNELMKRYYAEVDSDMKRKEKLKEFLQEVWKALIVSFDTTVSMDSEDRFVRMADLLRLVFLDDDTLSVSKKQTELLRYFCKSLSESLLATWMAYRDAYIVHGDAKPFLVKADVHIRAQEARDTLSLYPSTAHAQPRRPLESSYESSNGRIFQLYYV